MSVFVDTSAIYAMLDRSEAEHEAVTAAWQYLAAEEAALVTTSYVLVETVALCQRRLGVDAVRQIREALEPALEVVWIDEATHEAGVNALLAANSRDLSLVDCISFHTMRHLGLRRAFTLDRHFAERGFEVLPAKGS